MACCLLVCDLYLAMDSRCRLHMLFVLMTIAAGVGGTRIRLYNACPFTVWPAWLPEAGHPQLASGGARLDSWQLVDVYASAGWSGKFWGRTHCVFDTVLGIGCCDTGDCSNSVGCNTTFDPPATAIEFSLGHKSSYVDRYLVSLEQGYNLAVEVSSSSNPTCVVGGCTCDLNSRCPAELLVWNSRNMPVACNSPCLAFDSDAFCCRNEYFGPDKCHPNHFSLLFKECCPRSSTYPFDDTNTPLYCTTGSDYIITFCPEVREPKTI